MKNNNFLQPVISVLGLAISLIIAVLPIFRLKVISDLFLLENFLQPISFIAFLLGLAVIWLIIQHYPYIQINLGRYINRGKNYPEYWKIITATKLLWYLILVAIFSGFSFMILKFIPTTHLLFIGVIQSIFYLLFFLVVISIFTILFSLTKSKYDWEEQRDNLPQTIFQTLEKNRLIKPWIEIYENRDILSDELLQEGVKTFIPAKKIKIKTQIQNEEIIECIVSSDGKLLVKVLKKEKIK